MVRERPRFGSMAVGVLAGFGAGLLIAALLIAGRADRHMTRPVDAVVASVSAPVTTTPYPKDLASLAAQPPSSLLEATKTVTETQTITKTELISPTATGASAPELAPDPLVAPAETSVSVTPSLESP